MKKIFAVAFLFCCISFQLKAQMYYLPDTNFRNALINLGYGGCIVSDSIDVSCLGPADTLLDVSLNNIHSLEGVQAFSPLLFLECSDNQLTYIPLLPPSLTVFYCSDNQLTSLPTLPASLIDL
jgi:hypothetical protein